MSGAWIVQLNSGYDRASPQPSRREPLGYTWLTMSRMYHRAIGRICGRCWITIRGWAELLSVGGEYHRPTQVEKIGRFVSVAAGSRSPPEGGVNRFILNLAFYLNYEKLYL